MKKDPYTCSKGDYDFTMVANRFHKKPFLFFIPYSLTFEERGLDALFFRPKSVVKINYKAEERKRAA